MHFGIQIKKQLAQKCNIKASLSLILILFTVFAFDFSHAQDIDKDSLLRTYKEKDVISYSKENIELLSRLAESYRFRNPDSLLLFTKQLNDLSRQNNDFNGMTLGKIREGNYYSDIGEHKTALEKYLEAEIVLQLVDQPELKVDLFTQLAIASFFSGELEKSLESAYKGIETSIEHDLIWNEARLRHVLGFVYTQNQLYDEADEEMMKAIQLWKKTEDSLSLYGSRSNLARNAILSGDIQKAKKYFKGNITFFSDLNETLWLARSYLVQSLIFKAEKKYKQSIQSNKKYDSLLRTIESPRDRILSYTLYSKLYLLTNSYPRAKQYADSALIRAIKLNDSIELIKAYETLSEMAIQKSEFKEAAKYSSLALPIKEVLDKRFRENNLKIIRTKQELDFKRFEKDLEDGKRLIMQERITVIVLLLVGLILGVLFLARKIAKKQKDLNEELQEIGQTKNKLFSIIGHDLKSPMDTLHELLELYDSRTITEKEISTLLPKLKDNVDHSAFTLNNLLFWAQTQMKGITPQFEHVTIKEKATAVCSLYSTQLEKKNITIVCHLPLDLKVYADANHLEIILRNIISNAIKFTPNNGKITFNSKEKVESVEISICDNGIGMDQSTIDQLFNHEILRTKEGTNKEKGTGLGLQISKDLIRINRGEIEVESKVGKGSCFHILFPKDHA